MLSSACARTDWIAPQSSWIVAIFLLKFCTSSFVTSHRKTFQVELRIPEQMIVYVFKTKKQNNEQKGTSFELKNTKKKDRKWLRV